MANVALDRVLDDTPRYSMALLPREALDLGAPPAMARLPMTPEEVAAAYDDAHERQKPRQSTTPRQRARTTVAETSAQVWYGCIEQ